LPGYVATLSQMYRQNFSTSGLTRTIPWAAMAIGLGTIGAAAIGLFIPPGLSSAGETSQFRSQRQLLLVAVAWILPGLIFWLPQPLPILRHYMLIAIAVAWMVAWKLLSRLSRRNSTIVVASLLVVNLLIPDVAYRIYNRKHPEDPKSPNGTFFYYRGESKRNISRFQDLADRVVRVGLPTRDNNSFAYLSWEAYAYVLYAMAGSHHKMTTIGRSTFATVYQLYEYQLGEAQFRFVVSPWLSVLYAKDQLAEYARASAGSNYRVFLPAEATSEEMSDKSFDFPIVRY